MSRASPENLFRRTALRALHCRPLGRVVCWIPPAWSWIAGLLAAAFVSLLVLASHIEWHRTQAVRGWLVPAAGVARVVSPASGVVVDRTVEIGQSVAAGDVLAMVSTQKYGSGGASRNRDLIAAAINETHSRESLLAERYVLQLAKAQSRTELLTAENQSIQRQLVIERRRLSIEEQQLERLNSAGDAIPKWEVLNQEEVLAARQSVVEDLQQRKSRAERELSSLQSEITALPLDESLARSELLTERTQLQREFDDSEIALVAPVSGEVADIALSLGDAVKSGATLIRILPAGAELRAELYVPSSSAAHLKPGQSVRLFVDAWPREKFGAISGSVDRIAEFVGEETDSRGKGAYRVVVRLGPTGRPLRPGMSLGAELLLERRDLVDWVLGPLRSRFDL